METSDRQTYENAKKLLLNQHQLWLESQGKEGHRFDFSKECLTDANFSSASMDYCNFDSAQLTGSNYHSAFMIECNMQNITATSSDFTDAWLRFCDMSNADITGCSFNRASIKHEDVIEPFVWPREN
tara:strand:+ start:398 stop:778 length:381 start_codon:yes stop_codon:yes gene_type:complete